MRWTGKRDSKRDRMKETEKGKHVAYDVDERSLLMARLLPACCALALMRPLLVQLLHVGLVNLDLWRKGFSGRGSRVTIYRTTLHFIWFYGWGDKNLSFTYAVLLRSMLVSGYPSSTTGASPLCILSSQRSEQPDQSTRVLFGTSEHIQMAL